MSAPYTASDIANFVLAGIDREAGDSITHLKLQKLIYYCQAWCLALHGEPLFDEDMQAWAHGPVAESVFQRYRGFGWDAIPFPQEVTEPSPHHADLISDVLEVYGGFSAKHLERMTHAEEPWREARGDLPPEVRSTAPISKRTMTDFYRTLYDSTDGEE